ncbi:MAG: hypothetical protein ABI064_05030, partial [Acidobacteriaceae bacterium]
TDLHMMAISFNEQSLLRTRRLLLLPMGQGTIRIPNPSRWKRPVVLVGEVTGSNWMQVESFMPTATVDALQISITSDRALSMLIVCESGEQSAVIEQIEVWVNAPWKQEREA